MVIRRKQLLALEYANLQIFADRIVQFVRSLSPDCLKGLTEEELRKRALAGIARAKAFGLETDSAVGLFVMGMFLGGPGFEKEPECAPLLGDTTLPPDVRISHLFTDLVNVPWPSVRSRCEGNAW